MLSTSSLSQRPRASDADQRTQGNGGLCCGARALCMALDTGLRLFDAPGNGQASRLPTSDAEWFDWQPLQQPQALGAERAPQTDTHNTTAASSQASTAGSENTDDAAQTTKEKLKAERAAQKRFKRRLLDAIVNPGGQ